MAETHSRAGGATDDSQDSLRGMRRPDQAAGHRRSASASRVPQSRSVAFDDEAFSEQKREDKGDRKYDYVLRKQKLVEEQLKRLVQQTAASFQVGQGEREEVEKLLDGQKSDRRLLASLRSQMSSLKTRVDLLLSNEEQRTDRGHAISLNADEITALVQLQVQKLLGANVEDMVAKSLQERGQRREGHAQAQAHAYQPEFSKSAGVEKVSHLEKDQIRLASEFERMRTRVVALEAGQEQLRGTSSAREMRAEEVYTKSVHAHRVDVETFLSAAGRKVSDALGSVRANSGDIAELREELGAYVEGSGQALAELDLRLCDHDTQKDELFASAERMVVEIADVRMQAKDAEAALGQFLEDSLKVAKLSGAHETHNRQLQNHNERLEAVEMAAQAASSAVEANAVPIDLLAKSIDAINEKFEARTDALREGAEAHRTELEKSINALADAHKKTKNRVREVAEGVRGVAQIRQSIEAVLKEVDNRAKQDAAWTYSFKTAAQKLELRLSAMERYLSPTVLSPIGGAGLGDAGVGVGLCVGVGVGVAARGESRGGDELGGAGHGPSRGQGHGHGHGHASFAGTGSSTHFEEVRYALEQLRADLSGEFREEQGRLSDLLSGMMESQVEEVQVRMRQGSQELLEESEGKVERQLQRNSERGDKSAQRVKELIMDVQEQFILEHEELDRAVKEQGVAADEMEQALQQVRDTLEGLLDDREAERESLLGRLGGLDEQLTQVLEEQGTHAVHIAQATQAAGEGRQLAEQQAERGEAAMGAVRADIDAVQARSEELQGAISDQNRSLRELLMRSQEITANRCDSLQEGADVLKEDLSQHVSFSAQSHADLAEVLEERLSEVRRSTYAISESQEGLLGRCEEMVGFVSSSARKLVEDVAEDVAGLAEEQAKIAEETARLVEEMAKVAEVTEGLTEEQGRLQRAAAELEVSVASADAGARSKTAVLEKQLKAQSEGLESLSETANGLQNRITQQAGQLMERVASLTEQVALQTSIEDVGRVEAQLRSEIAAVGCQPELFALAARLDEVEGAVQMQGSEVAQLSSGVGTQAQAKLIGAAELAQALRDSEVKQSSRLTTVTDELLRTVNAHDAALRHTLEGLQLGLMQGEEQGNNTAEAMEAVESDIDQLREALTLQELRLAQMGESSAAHERVISNSDEVVRAVAEQLSAAETVSGKRHAELEHQIASSVALLKVKLTEAENRTAAIEQGLPAKLAPLSLFLNAQQSELQQLQGEITQLAEVDERVSAQTDQLSDHVKTLEDALLQRFANAEEMQVERAEQQVGRAEQMQASLQALGAQLEAAQGVAAAAAVGARSAEENLERVAVEAHREVEALSSAVDEQDSRLEALVERRCTEVRAAVNEETPSLEAVEAQGRRLQQLEEAQVVAGKSQAAAEQWLASQVGEGRALSEAQHAVALEKIAGQGVVLEGACKQRVGVLEQRLIRQEAAVKSRIVESEARLQGQLGSVQGQLEGVEGLGALSARVGVLEGERADVAGVLLRMGEIENGLVGQEARAQSQIDEIEGFIARQVDAFKGKVPAVPAGPHSPALSKRGVSASPPRSRTPGSGSKGAGGAGEVLAEAEAEASIADLSGISVGEVDDEEEEEVAAPLAGVRASDASLLFSSPGVARNYKQEESREELEAAEEGENMNDTGYGYGDEEFEEEEEGEKSRAEDLTAVHSILDGANFDIAALGMHLESFEPGTASARRLSALSQQEQADMQQAQEELQRKKSAHRRNFQKVLFESLS